MKVFLNDSEVKTEAQQNTINDVYNSNVVDGITITLDQGQRVIDCSSHFNDDAVLFVAEIYEHNGDSEFYNFSCTDDLEYSEYSIVERHFFTYRAALNSFISEHIADSTLKLIG